MPRVWTSPAARSAAAAVCLSLACAPAATHSSAGSPAPQAATAGAGERPRPYPMIESSAFAAAVKQGTRTQAGEPGPRYWQQGATYTLAARLDPATARLDGRATIRYRNASPAALDSVAVQLAQNLHQAGAPRNTRVTVTGGITLTRVAAGGTALAAVDNPRDRRGPGYRVDGTIGWVYLPTPLASGGTVELELDWWFTVPPAPNPRMGTDGEVFHVAYWYPQMAVYDDVGGWHIDPYLGNGEFYMGYADYDVALTVPTGWIVSATGELGNAADVLTPAARERLAQAQRSTDIIHVVPEAERAAGNATLKPASGELTWKYTARNVRDFTWNTSAKYVWDATHAKAGDATVMIHALYRAGTPAWDRAAEYNRHSIAFLSKYLVPYPWPQMTAVEGVITGGMEFPMITLLGRDRVMADGSRDSLSLHRVMMHEVAHMWFPMMVGTDERAHHWMDEGLANFSEAQGVHDFFPRVELETPIVADYLAVARAGREVPMMRHADEFPATYGPAYRSAAYRKPATLLRTLRGLLGERAFLEAFRTYARRWAFKHPEPEDFFHTFDQALARSDARANGVTTSTLDWFWRSWIYEAWPLDQAIGEVTETDGALLVTVEDRGLMPMPVWLVVTRADGKAERMVVPVDVWLVGAKRHQVRVAGAATVRSVEIDPSHVFADVDVNNQVWRPTLSRQSGPAAP